MEQFFLISLGAVLGANLRYWVADWAGQRWGSSFPFGTLLINLTGSLLLGIFLTLIGERYITDPRWRSFFALGFLGSYTTFSTYTFESMNLILKGQELTGLVNLFGSALLGGLAVLLGIWIGKLV